MRNYIYVTGGLHLANHKVSDQCLEINLETNGAITRSKMPEPRYAHAAIMIKETIYVTGGIADMMHPMGMRSVPMGSNACFKYNVRTARWSADMPELPIGKLYPTLIAIENRFIY